jgi:hypothetical protein
MKKPLEGMDALNAITDRVVAYRKKKSPRAKKVPPVLYFKEEGTRYSDSLLKPPPKLPKRTRGAQGR